MAKRYYDGSNEMIKSGGRAGMPEESFIKDYPNSNSYLPEDLNDSISGIDMQIKEDNAKKKGGFKPKKV